MLSSANKKKLRAMAQPMRAVVQIGKDGLSYNIIQSLDQALEAHELVKCSLLKTAPIEVRQAAIECAGNTHSEVVHIIGHTFILYRRSKENKLGIKK